MTGSLFPIQIISTVLLFGASFGIISLGIKNKAYVFYLLGSSFALLALWALFSALGNLMQSTLLYEIGYFFSGIGLVFAAMFSEYYRKEDTKLEYVLLYSLLLAVTISGIVLPHTSFGKLIGDDFILYSVDVRIEGSTGLLSSIVIISFIYIIYSIQKKEKIRSISYYLLELGFFLSFIINDFIVMLFAPLNFDYFYYLNGPSLLVIGIGGLILFFVFYNDDTLAFIISAKPDELLVIDKDGELLYAYSFEKESDVDYSMISRGLRGLATMVYEILESTSDLEDVVFSDRIMLATAKENIIYALFTKRATQSLRLALEHFTETFSAFVKNDRSTTEKIGDVLIKKMFSFAIATQEEA